MERDPPVRNRHSDMNPLIMLSVGGNCREGLLGCEWPVKSERSRVIPVSQDGPQTDRAEGAGAPVPNNFVFIQEFPDGSYIELKDSEGTNER